MDRIVVIRPGALGDVILTLPALQSLRARHPGAHITVVGSPSIWELAGDLVNERVSIDAARFATLWADESSEELRRWLEGVDCVVAWTVRDPSPALRAAGVPGVVHVSPYPPVGMHVAAWLCDPHPPNPLLPRVGEGGRDQGPLLPLTHQRERGSGGEGGTAIYLHPGAGALWKRWPAERFAAVGEALRDRGYDVMLIEGPADRDAIVSCQGAASDSFPVLCDLPVTQLAVTLGNARLYIGNDSGVTHLAAAAGAPTIALFGPTDPATWAPLGNARVLRHCDARAAEPRQIRVCEGDCLERVTVEEVVEAALDFLDVDNPVDNHDD